MSVTSETDERPATTFRLPGSLYARLRAQAAANHRSANAELLVILEQFLREPDGRPSPERSR